MRRVPGYLSIVVSGTLALLLLFPLADRVAEALWRPLPKETGPRPEPLDVPHEPRAELAPVILPPPPAAPAPAPAVAIEPLAPAVPEQPANKEVTPLESEPVKPSPVETKRQVREIVPLAEEKPEELSEAEPERPQAEPAAVPEAKSEPTVKALETSHPGDTQMGRALLRLLEYGKGPSVEIAWPASSEERTRLYRVFRTCYRLRIAAMTGAGALFVSDTRPGEPWQMDRAYYSGFVRSANRHADGDEAEAFRSIRARHSLGPSAQLVRVFPRAADAALLGGLKRLLGPDYAKDGRIQAHYALEGGVVHVGEIHLNGEAQPGRLLLAPIDRHCRS